MNDIPEGTQSGTSIGSAAPAAPAAPPTQAATQFGISANVNEVAIVFGHLRQLIDPATGAVGNRPALEWLLTVSLSPPVAVMLREALGQTVDAYEAQFGRIPRDPNSQLQMTPLR
jgi:hypothetical protein